MTPSFTPSSASHCAKRRGFDGGKFGGRDIAGGFGKHRLDAGRGAGEQMGPVIGRRAGDDAVVIGRDSAALPSAPGVRRSSRS